MIDEKKAVLLLRKYSPDDKTLRIILKHSLLVQKAAMNIAKDIKKADKEFIRVASLLHDVGRCLCPPGKDSIKHGIVGSRILAKEGLSRYAKVAERHLGVGISRKDIKKQNLPLPLKDYIPKSIEEKIIAYADNLVDGNKIKGISYVINRFKKELGEEYAKRVIKSHKEIERFRKHQKK